MYPWKCRSREAAPTPSCRVSWMQMGASRLGSDSHPSTLNRVRAGQGRPSAPLKLLAMPESKLRKTAFFRSPSSQEKLRASLVSEHAREAVATTAGIDQRIGLIIPLTHRTLQRSVGKATAPARGGPAPRYDWPLVVPAAVVLVAIVAAILPAVFAPILAAVFPAVFAPVFAPDVVAFSL